MIRLALSGAAEEFKRELLEWLSSNVPPQPKSTALDEFVSVGRQWQKMLANGRFIGVHWPEKFGGRGAGLLEEAVVQEELVRHGAPQVLGLFGLTMVGPIIIRYGTESQQERFLRNILSGEDIWCQGFSEPGAGSDLAAIRTKAEPCDGGYLVTGQKVWTSFAHIADWCFLLCRTEDSPQRHKGLSYLLVDMKTNGIKCRPLKQISGDAEFNEVFFESVFVPKENIVGEPGGGWKIALATLMYERIVLTFARQLQSEVAIGELVRVKSMTSCQKKQLATLIARSCAIRAISCKHLLSYSTGVEPGPEGSMDKLLWSECFQDIAKFSLDLISKDVEKGECFNELSNRDSPAGAYEGLSPSSVLHRYLYSRGRTIAAGSSEIQRNIIAERVLGLPRLKFAM